MAYRMSQLPVIFSDLEGHFCCLKPFNLTYLGKYSLHYLVYHMFSINRKAHKAYFNYLFENGLFKVTASHFMVNVVIGALYLGNGAKWSRFYCRLLIGNDTCIMANQI